MHCVLFRRVARSIHWCGGNRPEVRPEVRADAHQDEDAATDDTFASLGFAVANCPRIWDGCQVAEIDHRWAPENRLDRGDDDGERAERALGMSQPHYLLVT